MRRALALLAAVGAFMFLATGIAAAQSSVTTTTTTTPPTTTTTTTSTTTTTVPTTTAPPTTPTTESIGGTGDELPATGGDSLPVAQMAIVLLAAGGLGLMAVRREVPARVNADS